MVRRRRLAVIMGLGFAAGVLLFRPDGGHRVTPETVATLFLNACISPAKGEAPLPLATLDRRSVIPGDVMWEHPSGLLLSFTRRECQIEISTESDPGAPFHAALRRLIEEQVEETFPSFVLDPQSDFGPAWMAGERGSEHRRGVYIANFMPFGKEGILLTLFMPQSGDPLFPPGYGD